MSASWQSSQPLLRATGVGRDYRLPRATPLGHRGVRHALRAVDLELFERRSLGIVGESGSGKSTLARILLGLDSATTGEVTFRGQPVRRGRPKEMRWFRREAQIVLQDPLSSLDPRMTVESIIGEPLICLKIAGDHSARIDEVLDAVGLPRSSRRKYPHEFSGGQQQRIAIARAVAPRPSLLVGDEPVSALDVSVRVQILDLLKELAARYDLSLILVSHDLGVVRYLCDDVLTLHDGEVVERGTVESVFARPSHPYTKALLSAVPRLPIQREVVTSGHR